MMRAPVLLTLAISATALPRRREDPGYTWSTSRGNDAFVPPSTMARSTRECGTGRGHSRCDRILDAAMTPASPDRLQLPHWHGVTSVAC
jgi:hypothetical protein